MTVALVRHSIQTFIQTQTPQVLCIRGKWGVGKTFIWNEALRQAIEEGVVALPHYSYVSLFGLQSIDEVRQSVFENSIPTREAELQPTLDSLIDNIKRYTRAATQQVAKLSPYAKLPYLDTYVSNFSGGFRQIVSLAVRDTIVCFDDFERKKISAKDLLGLVSQFREQKACKAVIILNEDALSDEEKKEFRRYFEKVVDIPIEFSPTPDECADIAVKEADFSSQRIRENSVNLGISNIRIIYRVKGLAQDLMRILKDFSEDIRRQALHTLALLVWSKYADDAVPMEKIVHREEKIIRLMKKEARSEEDRKWDEKLDQYGFSICDELDKAIMVGVDRGFFDETEIVKQAREQHVRQEAATAQKALEQAWRPFHDSFDSSNVAAVIDEICATYKQHMKYVSRNNMDNALEVFKTLGFGEKASDLIASYIDAHAGHISSVDERADPFHRLVKDNEFRAALAAAVVAPPRTPMKDILTRLYGGEVGQEGIEAAYALSADDLYELFSRLRGDELYPVVEGSLFFRQVANATDQQRALTRNALAALKRIGGESAINAIRVKKFRVEISKSTPPNDEPPGAPDC